MTAKRTSKDALLGRIGAEVRRARERLEASRGATEKLLPEVCPAVRREAEKIAGTIIMEWRDRAFMAAFALADDGDKDAPRVVHQDLARAASENSFTPAMQEWLAALFDALSVGGAPEIAVFKHPARGGRPRRELRDSSIRWFVRTMVQRAAEQGSEPNMPAIYDVQATLHGLSRKTIKNICANDPENDGIFPG